MRKIKYSNDTDTLLIELSDKEIDHAEEQGQVIIHFSKKNLPVLIEIMDASQFITDAFSSVVKQREVVLP
jgi:uncharacterized protein YuzE